MRTPALLAEEAAGHALWAGITDAYRPGADVVGPALAGTVRDLPDVNVVRHGGRLLALAESERPFRLGPTSSTLGPDTFGGHLPAGITAHPKIDPRTGEMAVFCYRFTPPFLTWAIIRPDGTAVPPTPIDGVERPSLDDPRHGADRALPRAGRRARCSSTSARLLAGGSLLSWQPEHGTRVALIPRDGGPVRWCADDTFWTWHTANAYEADDPVAGNPVVLDYVQWDAPAGLAPGQAGPGAGRLARATIDPAAGTIRREQLSDDRRRVPAHRRPQPHPPAPDHRPHRGQRPAPPASRGRRHPVLVRPRTGATTRWTSPDLAVGELAHAPHPDSDDPDDGWWLTFATHRATGDSWLLVIPAADPGAGPQARVRMPVRVPLGLHGTWLPDHPEPTPPTASTGGTP